MNSNPPEPSREQIEVRLTALLLGELPPAEAELLRWTIQQDPELAKLHDRLKSTLDLMQEATASQNQPETKPAPPLKMSEERRQKLLAHFKTAPPTQIEEQAEPDEPLESEPVSPKLVKLLLQMAAAFVLVGLLAYLLTPRIAGRSEKARSYFEAPTLGSSMASSLRDAEDYRGDRQGIGAQSHPKDSPKSQPPSRNIAPPPLVANASPTPAPLPPPARVAIVLPPNKFQTLNNPSASGPASSDNQPAPNAGAFKFAANAISGNGDSSLAANALPAIPPPSPQTVPANSGAESAATLSPGVLSINGTLPVAGTGPSEPLRFDSFETGNLADGQKSGGFGGGFGGFPQGAKRTPPPEYPSTPNGTIKQKELNRAVSPLPQPTTTPNADQSPGPPPGGVASQNVVGFYIARENNNSAQSANNDQPDATASPLTERSRYYSNSNQSSKLPASDSLLEPIVVNDTASSNADRSARGKIDLGIVSPAPSPKRAISPTGLPREINNRTPSAGEQPLAGDKVTSSRRQEVFAAPIEVMTRNNPFSTFSLNVSDVSFKLAAASFENNTFPSPANIRSEEFINAFDYRDPEPPAGAPVGFAWERAGDPFAHNRDFLRLSIKTAAEGRQAGKPLNLVVLLDKSGSMERADRVAIIREALRVLATQLGHNDTLSVITFARTAQLRVDGLLGDQAQAAFDKLSGITPEGGTNLEEAMNLAYATALRHYLNAGINRVVLLTDGAANLGNLAPQQFQQKVESNRKLGIALDCFGVGWEDYNDHLLEMLASHGGGRYGFLNTPEEAAGGFGTQLAGALRVAAADVKVQVEFNPARVTAYRQFGYATHQLATEQFRDNTVNAAAIGAAESGNALYTIQLNPQGDGPIATVRVRFHPPGSSVVQEHSWLVPYTGASPALDQSSPAMRLAAVAGSFAEFLQSALTAQDAPPDQLLKYLDGVPQVYNSDPRPAKLERMIRQSRSLAHGGGAF